MYSAAHMDFHIDSNEQYPQETTRHPGMNPVMRVLEEVLDPTGTRVPAFNDCIIISLDTEHDSHSHKITQVGVASLDTRDIQKADDDEDPDSAQAVLSSRLILLQRQSSKKGLYLFGTPEKHYKQNPRELLLPILKIPDANSYRNIVLVGHSIRNDLQEIYRSTGLDILKTLPMIKAVVDTSPLINRVYGSSQRYHSLRNTCALLGMYRRNIHTAGNDAMYTLKALLLLFCHYKETKQSWNFSVSSSGDDDELATRALLYECQLEAVKKIARCNNRIPGRGRRRKKKKREGQHASFRRENKNHLHDMLMGEETELMGGLFSL